MSVIGGAEGARTPGLRIANGKNGVLMHHQKLAICVKTPNTNAAANKISTATNYDPESPILTKFGNVLATGKMVRLPGMKYQIQC